MLMKRLLMLEGLGQAQERNTIVTRNVREFSGICSKLKTRVVKAHERRKKLWRIEST
jgi:hypothetical protein